MSLFVVSDVHGYVDDLRNGLAGAGLIGDDDTWTGEDHQLWVLGDLLDRGPDGIGSIDLVRSLQQQAPDNVHMLMGNHEALALGYKQFPETRFGELWALNGGLESDQKGLSEDHLAWMRSLPVLARAGDFLLMHSDATDYLEWGSSVEEVNESVTSLLADDTDDAAALWGVFASLTNRFDFAGQDGSRVAQDMLRMLGGSTIVHGHSIIGSLVGKPSEEVEGPISYADGLVIAIDGGRYDGGPLLVVELG